MLKSSMVMPQPNALYPPEVIVPPHKAPSLEGIGLTKRYGGRAVVNDVRVRVGKGEVVGLLGPNGAGKTTTFYILVGLLRPDSGRIELNGAEITMLPLYQRARRGISYLPQEPSVFRKLTVEQNLLAVLEDPAADRRRAQRTATVITRRTGYRPAGTEHGGGAVGR